MTSKIAKKMTALVTRMALKNFQLTENRLILQSEPKIRDGKQKVPTNVAKPLDSESDKKLNLKNWKQNVSYSVYVRLH